MAFDRFEAEQVINYARRNNLTARETADLIFDVGEEMGFVFSEQFCVRIEPSDPWVTKSPSRRVTHESLKDAYIDGEVIATARQAHPHLWQAWAALRAHEIATPAGRELRARWDEAKDDARELIWKGQSREHPTYKNVVIRF